MEDSENNNTKGEHYSQEKVDLKDDSDEIESKKKTERIVELYYKCFERQESEIVDCNEIDGYTISTPEFPGGINSFRQRVAQFIDYGEFEGKGLLQTMISFIVEPDGTMSNISAKGDNIQFNNEGVNALKSIKAKWVPARLAGVYVRFKMRLPLGVF